MGEAESRFGAWLKARRIAYDLTQRELGERVSCSAVTIRKVEAGTLRPSRQVAELLASVLEVPMDERAEFVRLARAGAVPGILWEGSDKQEAAALHAGNLPTPTTALIGRQAELAELQALLLREDVRLVTLTGPPGVGKTRLALQAAAGLLDEAELFPDGVWFVELAALVETGLVVPTIAQTLGLKEAGGTPILDTLRAYLREKHLLLVLDNFEHVVGAAPQVGQLVAYCPHLKVLITSRMPLRIKGEKGHPVPPLALPPATDTKPGHPPSPERLTQYEAVRLFIERAIDIKPDFQVTGENASAVAQICVRLDGLPLAIELAAARVTVLPPQAMLSRLENRLKVLTGGARDLPPRQQTLRNTIEWSYELLTEGEKQLFRRMAIFQGERTLEALEAVCNHDGQLQIDALDGVAALVDNSLLHQRLGANGEAHFWMLETIHEYAREKLAESGEAKCLQREHALYFMKLAEEAEPHLTGQRQQEWVDRLGDEYDNFRAALEWAIRQAKAGASTERSAEVAAEQAGEAAEAGLRTAGALWRFWAVKSLYTEGREHLRRVLELTEPEAPAQGRPSSASSVSTALRSRSKAKALGGAGNLAFRQGDYSSAQSLLTAALELGREIGDKQIIAFSLNGLGNVAAQQGDYTAARSLQNESLALWRELGDELGIATSLHSLGDVAMERGDYTAARSLDEESLALMRELGYKWGIAASLGNLGVVAWEQGDFTAARALYEESLALLRELGDKWSIGVNLNDLGGVALNQGDYTEARSLFVESLALRREIGDKRGIATSLVGLGGVAIREAVGVVGVVGVGREGQGRQGGEVESGARLLGAAEGLLQSLGGILDLEDRKSYEWSVKQARSLLGDEAFEKARQEGRTISMEEAIEYALEDTETTGSRP
jgi:predicted ATPase/DNA-binding XRE family transcriptional regulator